LAPAAEVLVVLYVAFVALASPYWMSGQTEAMPTANRVFWSIARILSGYGVIGVPLVFLILPARKNGTSVRSADSSFITR
jgi:hypothetical protein